MKSGVALALLLGASMAGQAAGLGKLTVNSALGQVLNAEIDLVSLQAGEADALNARVAPPEAFRDARIEYSPALRLLRFQVDKRPNGQPFLKVTSAAPINEPFVDALIEVSWPSGRLQREYPILLDPPGYAQAKVAPPTVAAAPAAAPAAATAAPAAAPTAETPPATEPAATPSATEPASTAASAEPAAAPSAQGELAAAKPAAAGAAAGDTYGPIEKGETLSKIAGQVKPADVSLEQMLVALYRENKGAFSGNNMNRLKTGQILKVPAAEEVAAIKPGEAGREIRTHVADWNTYRSQLASGVASKAAPSEATNVATGRVGGPAVTPPPAATAPSQDTLRLSRTETSGKAGGAASRGGAAAQDRVNAMQEELTAKDKALQEANSRVADLEKQIRDMQRLLDLKGAPAKADTKVATATPAPTPAPAKAPEAAKPAEAPKPVEAPKAAEAPKPAEAAKPAEAPKVAQATPAEPPKAAPPKPAAKPASKAVPKPAPEKDWMDELLDNPMYLAGGIGAIALLGIAGFMVSRRRRTQADAGPSSAMTSAFPSDLKPSASTTKPASGLVDTGNSSFLTDFDKTGPGTIDTDEVDPVAEAEVYIAYGRDAQAEEILKEAMARDRNRHEIALKLLEIYHARKSATAFETVAKELRAAVGEASPLWQKAAAMGAQIDPTNPLYAAAAAGTATFTAMAPTPPAAAPAKPDLDFDIEGGASPGKPAPAPSFDLDLDAQRAAPAPDLPVSEQSSPKLDFDLAPGGAHAVDVPAEPAKEEKAGFDFDLSGLDFPSSKQAASAPAAHAAASSGSSMDLADLSLDSAPHSDTASAEAVGTKLELAKAYLEIGDKDGAREILHEVAKEGSSAQKEEAKKLIASL